MDGELLECALPIQVYRGLSIEAIPTPIPAQKRMATKKIKLGAIAMPNEERAKIRAAVINPGFRPKRSARDPATRQPNIQPNAREPVRKPSHQAFKANTVLRKGSAPAMTAKSKPKRYPPKAEIKDIRRIYR